MHLFDLPASAAAALLAVTACMISTECEAQAATGPLGFGDAEIAQPLESDRPDFTEGTQALALGHYQLELGYTFAYNRDRTSESREHQTTLTHGVPETLLRLGLLQDLELRLGWGGYESGELRDSGSSSRTEGVTDLSIGLKQHVLEQRGLLPALAYILELGIPSGSAAVRSSEPEPAVKLLWSADATDSVSIAGNLNYAARETELGRTFELAGSLAVGFDLSARLGSFLEYFGFAPHSAAHEDTHYLNGGFTYGFTPNLQADIRAGIGLNPAADDFFSGIGVVYRR